MTTLKKNSGTITLLIVITALLYLTIFQYKAIKATQITNEAIYEILMEYTAEPQQTEDSDSEAPDFDGGEQLTPYELQQESGEYAPFESGKLYIPIDTPDQI